jgi:hypothetical protein
LWNSEKDKMPPKATRIFTVDEATGEVRCADPSCAITQCGQCNKEQGRRKRAAKNAAAAKEQKEQVSEKAAKESHTILPNGTPVFVPPIVGGYGIRGVVVGWHSESRRYSVQFVGSSSCTTTGSVPMQKALLYIDKANMSSYPSDALPFDSSVRCAIHGQLRDVLHNAHGTDVDHVCGIIQGVAAHPPHSATYLSSN